uniref:Extracellular calcium-sensing receptor-like n=1 Tax=Hippocampus comes TaxID=109280 RepID=A0A3Q2XNS3_HIPCM
MGWFIVILISSLATTKAESQTCKLIGQTGFLEFSKEGDLLIGGIFSLAMNLSSSILNPRFLTYLQFMFTVEEINRNAQLLPGVSLGYQLYNGCGSENLIRAAIEAISQEGPACSARIQALLGHSSSGISKNINTLLSPLSIPQVSHLSTCACLSDKSLYPTFFRTVPSDRVQVLALVQLMKNFDWRWVGIIYSSTTYADKGTAEFVVEAMKEHICVEYRLVYSKASTETHEAIVKMLRESSSKVVLLFMSLSYTKSFLSKMAGYNISGKQWVGSEAWITQLDLASVERQNILQGAMGFALPEASIPGLGNFLLDLKPSDEPQSGTIKAFWEKFFDCSFSPSNTSTLCTGGEDMKAISNDYTDVTHFRAENNMYKAVYLVAYALHALLQCENGANPTTGKPCVIKSEIFVNDDGDSVGEYDLINWHMRDDGSVKLVNIGRYDASFSEYRKLKLKGDAKIVWGGNSTEVLRSVCKEPCPPGTRKAVNKNKPVCCFDCFECPEGTISNQTDSPDCLACPPEFWPNAKKDRCVPKPTEYLSYKEIMGALLTALSCVGVFLAFLTFLIFLTHKETPIVKANNSELSFLLLISLKLCFLCSLTFIGRPTEWSCMLRHAAFGITFVLCISCVLGKTVVVLMAFRATLPGKNMKLFGHVQQRLSVLALTVVQVLFCIIWLCTNPPFPATNLKYYKEKIILECALGSAIGFWGMLGYIGLLALLCFTLAFMARKLPDSFNEAKLITFSMLIFCAVWMAFIPAYVSSPGKFTVAVEIFAILASSFGLLVCIFVPKCYIIIFRPENNTRKHLMGKIPPRTL